MQVREFVCICVLRFSHVILRVNVIDKEKRQVA